METRQQSKAFQILCTHLAVRGASLFFTLSFVISIFPACSNIRTIGNLNNLITSAPPSGGQGGSGAFNLSRVVLDTKYPGTTLDLMGDGTGTLGNLCTPTDGSPLGSSTSATVCNCTFAYNSASSPNQQIDVPLTYHEMNMVRCPYNPQIPKDVTSVNVSIHLTSADTYSNTVTISINGNGAIIDPTNPNSFVAPVRYQCKDILNIGTMMDGNIYDPIQSEDPHLSYPLDFYASNLADAVNKFVSFSPANDLFMCPPLLNAQAYLDPTTLAQFNSNFGMNMTVRSVQPLPNGTNQIYPHVAGEFDRSTFYLAKTATGIFTVPVNSYLAPAIYTSANSALYAPIGYGAAPIPSAPGYETCPSDTQTGTIPPGFKWAKLWLMRASLPQRSTFSSTDIVSGVQQIVCNPHDWVVTDNTASGGGKIVGPIVPACYVEATTPEDTTNQSSISLYEVADNSTTPNPKGTISGAYLADRILQNYIGGNASPVCIRLQSYAKGGTPALLCGSGTNAAGPACTADGFDLWTAEAPAATDGPLTVYNGASTIGCNNVKSAAGASTVISDPLGVCPSAVITPIPNPLPAATPSPLVPTAVTAHIVATPWDTGVSINRFDYLFVVSPPTVMSATMTNETDSNRQPYIPTRTLTSTDCTDTTTQCSDNYKINYDVKFTDVGQNSNDPVNGQIVFPVCVLQPG